MKKKKYCVRVIEDQISCDLSQMEVGVYHPVKYHGMKLAIVKRTKHVVDVFAVEIEGSPYFILTKDGPVKVAVDNPKLKKLVKNSVRMA